MEYIKKLIDISPFDYDVRNRDKIFSKALSMSFKHHMFNCNEYRQWNKKNNISKFSDIEDINSFPYLPSSIFKKIDLISSKNYYKKITSSGTSGQKKSRIYLDKTNAINQTIVLSKILTALLGSKRNPFLIIDVNPKTNSASTDISARTAGMSGYLMASSEQKYLLKVNYDLNTDYLNKIIIDFKNKNKVPVIIGYTYLIFQKLLKEKKKFDLPKDTKLIHFGGWKKLKDKSINKKELNKLINKKLGIQLNNIFDIYGFSEQLGTVYPSIGNEGCKVPAYSKIIVRDTKTLEVLPDGKIGYLQFISPIPSSYPGVSILNDDLGRIIKKKENIVEFEVTGRESISEDRGCGDTLPKEYYI